MFKTRVWILAIAAVAGAAALALAVSRRDSGGTVAQVIQDGTVIREIDLSDVREPFRFTVESPDGGSNTILVEPGRICVSEADCPDQVCVRQGWLSSSAAPIICLPHRLVVSFAEHTENAPDAAVW